MLRVMMLVPLVLIALACSSKDTGVPPPLKDDGSVKAGGPGGKADGGFVTADLLRIKPKYQFKAAGEHSSLNPSISADGKFAAIQYEKPGARDATQVWDLSGEPKPAWEAKTSFPRLSPTGRRVHGRDGIFEKDGVVLGDLPDGGPSGKRLFVSEDIVVDVRDGDDGELRVWNLATKAKPDAIKIGPGQVTRVNLVGGGREAWVFVDGGKKGGLRVQVCDLGKRAVSRTITPRDPDSTDAEPSWRTRSQVAGDGSIFLWESFPKYLVCDGETGNKLRELPKDFSGPDSAFLGVRPWMLGRLNVAIKKLPGWNEKDSLVFDVKSNKVLAVLTGLPDGSKGRAEASSADGNTVLIVAKDGTAAVYDLSGLK